MTHPDDAYLAAWISVSSANKWPSVIFFDNCWGADQVAPDTFLADIPNRMLEVWDAGNRDLNKVLVEAPVRQEVSEWKAEEPVWNHDQSIRRNIIAFNRDAQIALDCRVTSEQMKALRQCYPKEPVPGVMLGEQP